MFAPVQVAGIAALNGPQDCVSEIVNIYRSRRDVLCNGLNRAGWPVTKPSATMFVWAPIPEPFRAMGSLEFAKFLLREAKVAVSPGVGFGADGDGFVRFALIENEHRTRQALRGIRHALDACGDAGLEARRPAAWPDSLSSPGDHLKAVRLALLGCGTVGTGVVKLLRGNAALFERRLGRPLELAGVADRSLKPDRSLGLDARLITRDAAALSRAR